MGTGEISGDTARRANSAGLAALRAGDGAAAVAAFAQATAADPAAGALWRNLAHAHRLTGNAGEERAALNRALGLDRTDFVAQLRLAQLLERQGEALAALTAWSGALQLAERLPETPPALTAELAVGRGYVAGLTARLGAASDAALAPLAGRLDPTGLGRQPHLVEEVPDGLRCGAGAALQQRPLMRSRLPLHGEGAELADLAPPGGVVIAADPDHPPSPLALNLRFADRHPLHNGGGYNAVADWGCIHFAYIAAERCEKAESRA